MKIFNPADFLSQTDKYEDIVYCAVFSDLNKEGKDITLMCDHIHEDRDDAMECQVDTISLNDFEWTDSALFSNGGEFSNELTNTYE